MKIVFTVLAVIAILALTSSKSLTQPPEQMTGNKGYGPEGYFVSGPAAPKEESVSMEPSFNYAKTYFAYPTGHKGTSILWITKRYPKTVKVGQPFTYTIDVKNLTHLSVPDVVVTEDIISDYTSQNSDPTSTIANGKISWALGTLNPGETRHISQTGMMNARGDLPCCTAATYGPPTLCIKTAAVKAEMALALTAPPKVMACEGIPLGFTINNPGDATVVNANITSQLPEGATFAGRNSITLNAGKLKPGVSKNFTRTIQAEAGTYTFNASAAAEDGLKAEAQVSTAVVKPVLGVTAEADVQKQFTGRMMSYSLTVHNMGNAPAESVVLNAFLEGAMAESATSNGALAGDSVKWQLGSIAPGDSKAVTLNARAVNPGMIRMDATAMGDCAVPSGSAVLTEAMGVPALLLEMVDTNDPLEVGQNGAYMISVTNQGSAPAANVKLTAILDNSQDFMAASGVTDGSFIGNTVTFAPLASLGPHKTAEWRVEFRGLHPADARFKVSMTSDELRSPVEETEATRIY